MPKKDPEFIEEEKVFTLGQKILLILGSIAVGSLIGDTFLFKPIKEYVSSLDVNGQLMMVVIALVVILGGFLDRKK